MFDLIGVKNPIFKNKIITLLFFLHRKNSKIKPNKYLSFIQVCLLFSSKRRLQCCQLVEYFLAKKELTDERFSSLLNFLLFFEKDIHTLVELSESKEEDQDLITSFLNSLLELTGSYICKSKINKRVFDNNLKKLLIEFVAKAESEPEQAERITLSM